LLIIYKPALYYSKQALITKMSTQNAKTSGLAKTLEPFVCGGLSATFASVVIHPIDLAKVG